MNIEEMSLPNAFRIRSRTHRDRRGSFAELVRESRLSEYIGYPFKVAQVNVSVSRRGTIRGLHGTALPPGQAKLVSCVAGAVLDVAVDMRVGSPTFGMFDVTRQDAESGVSVYLADGLGHGFMALTDGACVNYLCSESYVPGTMIEADPLDPALGIPWQLSGDPVMSEKDAAAPRLADLAAAGQLPTYSECLEHYAMLGRSQSSGGEIVWS
ncbi:dTDP-4-dehydrorhamnose 3,5-epimerase family protein [Rhodococcus qingshengii]|uniref:dTDP-4-dehydrorhamnose 3,5-epimerase family protein n=1 Tax=Rhodococcus qingshengii TaxID=334542 RepID=UPI0036DFA3AA